MLPKQRRIPRSFFGSFKGARTFRGNTFLIKVAEHGNKESRFCVSVSKKVAKNAVLRNKLRRLGYKLLEQKMNEAPPYSLIQISWRAVPEDEAEASKDLSEMLIKLNKK